MEDLLASVEISTDRTVTITVGRLYTILRKLGLKPNRFSAKHLALREKALELNRSGKSPESIAQHFNEQGFKSASGKSWSRHMVYGLLHALGNKAYRLEAIHRDAIREARGRGLNYRQMAEEFNQRGIRRRDGQPWRPIDNKNRSANLNRLESDREQKGSIKTEPLQRSA